MSEDTKIVTVKNYPMRSRIMGIFSLPLLLIISTIIALPIVLLSAFTFSTGIIMTVAAEIITICIALAYTKGFKDWRVKLRLQNFNTKNIVLSFGLGVVMMILLQVCVVIVSNFGGKIESSDTSVSLESLHGISRYIILYLMVPFLVPMLEEIFFRGYTMGFIADSFENKKKGFIIGLIISSIAFSLAHFQGLSSFNDVFLLIWIGLIAVVNGIIMWRTNSVFNAMALHVGYNSVTVVAGIVLAGVIN